MTETYEPLSPVDIERKLRALVTELTRAQQQLAEARDIEIDRKHDFEATQRGALLSEDRPRVERGGWTTAERDAWVADQCSGERREYELAEARRKAAEDHLRVTRDQASVVQTLARSVQQAYGMAGVTER